MFARTVHKIWTDCFFQLLVEFLGEMLLPCSTDPKMLFPCSSRRTPIDWFPSPHYEEALCSHKNYDGFNSSSGTNRGKENFIKVDDVQTFLQSPSSTFHDDKILVFGTNQTFRDFSGVPPTEEDRDRYNKKKNQHHAKRLTNGPDDNDEHKKYEGHDRFWDKRGRGNREAKDGSNRFIGFMGTNFPARLHDLLSHDEDISDIISWLPHGRSWIVRDKKEFLMRVAPSHFQISKYESFTRQVNGWGFKRITQGPDINSYYHELFLRGMPHLIQWMKRSTSSGPRRNKQIRSDPRKEPNFYAISQMYPIPDYYGEGSGNDGSLLQAIDDPTVTSTEEEEFSSAHSSSETNRSISKPSTSKQEEEEKLVSEQSMIDGNEDTISRNDIEEIKNFWISNDAQNPLNSLESDELFGECTNL